MRGQCLRVDKKSLAQRGHVHGTASVSKNTRMNAGAWLR